MRVRQRPSAPPSAMAASADHLRTPLVAAGGDDDLPTMRPSLGDLLGGQVHDVAPSTTFYESVDRSQSSKTKYGTFNGVFVRCLLNIFSVLVFLSNGYIVGQAGLLLVLLIQAVSAFVTVVTTISASALCTNGRMMGGGPYYLVSRSLGIEYGATVGIMFFFASSIAIALGAVGLGQTIASQFPPGFHLVSSDPSWDPAVIAILTNLAVLVLCLFGVGLVNVVNNFLSVGIYLGFFSFIIGACGGGRSPGYLSGYTGMSASTLGENMTPHFSAGETFFTMAALYFPSVTGFLAGANVSGELKNPSRSVPVGTLMALLVNNLTYLLQFFVIAASARYTLLTSDQNYLVDIAVSPALMTLGIYAVSISGSIGSIVGAPRVLAAVASDGMFTSWSFLAKVSRFGDPYYGYVLSTLIGCIFSVSGGLNQIAAVVSNAYLLVYAIINYSCFAAAFARVPSWRPGFAYYNMWLSLFGSGVCIALMFLIDYISAGAIIIAMFCFFKYVQYRANRRGVRLGGASESYLYRAALKSLKQVQTNLSENVKNFRPQLLILENISDGEELTAIVRLFSYFYKTRALIMRAKVFLGDPRDAHSVRSSDAARAKETEGFPSWKHDILFCTHLVSTSIAAGLSQLLQTAGLGRVRPNVLVCGPPVEPSSGSVARAPSPRSSTPASGPEYQSLCSSFAAAIRVALQANVAVMVPMNCRSLLAPGDWFPEKRFFGSVDLFWLADDGGLGPLLAHLLLQSSYWKTCSLRIFVPPSAEESDAASRVLDLLSALRIRGEAHVLYPIHSSSKAGDAGPVPPRYAGHAFTEYREAILQHAAASLMALITLPVPHEEDTDGRDYVALLQAFCLPATCTVLLRGNQTNVLTPYL